MLRVRRPTSIRSGTRHAGRTLTYRGTLTRLYSPEHPDETDRSNRTTRQQNIACPPCTFIPLDDNTERRNRDTDNDQKNRIPIHAANESRNRLATTTGCVHSEPAVQAR